MAAMLTSTVRVNPAGALGLSPHLHPLVVGAVVLLLLGMVPDVGIIGMVWVVVVVGVVLLVVVAMVVVVVVVAVATDVADSVVVGVEGSFPISSPPPSPLAHNPYAPGLLFPSGGQSMPCQG